MMNLALVTSIILYLPMNLEHVFNSMADAVITIDRNNRLIAYNQAAGRLYPDLLLKTKGEPLNIPVKGLPALNLLEDGFETDVETSHENGLVYYHIRVVAVKK